MSLLAEVYDLHKPEFTCRARSDDPITSILAGRNADKFAASHAGRILAVLQLHGDLSPKQISDYTGLTVVQIDRRRHEMKRDGLITVLDEIRHGCQVWRALPNRDCKIARVGEVANV